MIEVTFISNGGKIVNAPENSNLLRVSLQGKGGIPFQCRIEQGIENTDTVKEKELQHLTSEEVSNGYRMACQTFVVKGRVSVSWAPRKR